MTNKHKSVLYTGVTSDLVSRVQEHMTHHYPKSFTARYNVEILVYYESFACIEEAIQMEKRIKKWRREKKEALINTVNPGWENL